MGNALDKAYRQFLFDLYFWSAILGPWLLMYWWHQP